MSRTKTILIIGGSGFIGTHLALRLKDTCKVFATYYKHPIRISGVTTLPMHVSNRNWIKRVFQISEPDVVIYAAGSNNLHWSEANARYAEEQHTSGPTTLAASADTQQPRFIFLSNSYVFDGSRGNYHESDTVLPNSILGRMKVGGENIVRSKCLNFLILRSSPVFGRSNGYNLSFLDNLRMTLDRGQRIEVSSRELHSFAHVSGLCEVIQRLIESGIRNRVIHYGGLTKVNHFEFAKKFAVRFGYDPSLIINRVSTSHMGTVLEDSHYDFSLNSTQLVDTLKIKPFLLEESFDLIDQQLIARS